MSSEAAHSTLWLLYLETALSSFGERLWQFAVPLLLATMFPNSMWPAASLALVETFAGFAAGPSMGVLLDRVDRYQVVWYAVVGQNLSIAVASACFYVLVWQGMASEVAVPTGEWRFWLPMIGLYITAALNAVAALLDSVSLSKIWVPAVCAGDDVRLRHANASLRRINLFCEVAAPFVFGSMLSFLPRAYALKAAIAAVVLWNALSFGPELWVLNAVYRRTPALAAPPPVPRGGHLPMNNPIAQAVAGWQKYWHHTVFLVSLAYAFLFLTVLMPGALMTSFLIYWRIEQWEVAVFRGVCAVTGIGATLLSPLAMSRFGIVRAGVAFVWAQWIFLVPAVAFAFAPMFLNERWPLYAFMAMVTLSRMGLWGFDLVEVHIMQTGVELEKRGEINSVEYATTQLATMMTYVVGMFINDPRTFVWLVAGSGVSVLVAAILFSFWARFRSQAYLQRAEVRLVTVPESPSAGDMELVNAADDVLASDDNTIDREM